VLSEGPELPPPLALLLGDAVVEVAVVEGAGAAVVVGVVAGGVVVVVWPPARERRLRLGRVAGLGQRADCLLPRGPDLRRCCPRYSPRCPIQLLVLPNRWRVSSLGP